MRSPFERPRWLENTAKFNESQLKQLLITRTCSPYFCCCLVPPHGLVSVSLEVETYASLY